MSGSTTKKLRKVYSTFFEGPMRIMSFSDFKRQYNKMSRADKTYWRKLADV